MDRFSAIALRYGEHKHAIVSTSGIAQSPEETVVVGTQGWLRIHSPAHCPTELSVTRLVSRTEQECQSFSFPYPDLPANATPLNFPGSEGFQYQARAVQDAIQQGRTEHELYPHHESLAVCGIMDTVRAQLGLRYPGE